MNFNAQEVRACEACMRCSARHGADFRGDPKILAFGFPGLEMGRGGR
jgi:hypothetical protein